MEHLDLAGYMSTPPNWNLGVFEQQDAIYLSNSRQMLEPIMEETSEDEDHAQNSWNQCEHGTNFWSSAESETGSVIRVEVSKDLDAISERDFVCPPKRARRSDDLSNLIGNSANAYTSTSQPSSLDDTVLLRRPQRYGNGYDLETNNSSLERFLSYEACARDSYGSQGQRNSTGSRRFDDFYSDTDSYHSLSRSSSLVQFESLERQLLLQEQHASMQSLGNSSPSLLSFEACNSSEGISGSGNCSGGDGSRSGANSGNNSGNNSRRGSQNSLMKRYESSDGRLHQTYYELNKLNFDDDEDDGGGGGVGSGVGGGSRVGLYQPLKALAGQESSCVGEVKSDSESSTSSSAASCCSGNSILTASKPSVEDLTDSSCMTAVSGRSNRIAAYQARGGKNSAENLSEDSGYCEPSTLRRTKSKSIPKNFDKFCEEEEECQFGDVAGISMGAGSVAGAISGSAVDIVDCSKNTATTIHSKNSNVDDADGGTLVASDLCQPKINNATFLMESNVVECALPALAQGPAAVMATTATSYTAVYVKNSAQRAATQQQRHEDELEIERRRSLAHSPSPVSSDISTASTHSSRSSASTAASCVSKASSSAASANSAASFTWLPMLQQRATEGCRTALPTAEIAVDVDADADADGEPTSNCVLNALDEFSVRLRSSLPDIREVFGSENSTDFSSPTSSSASACSAFSFRRHETTTNGYVLDQLKTAATAADDDDNNDDEAHSTSVTSGSSAASSPTTSATHSDAISSDAETSPEVRKRLVNVVGGSVGVVAAAAAAADCSGVAAATSTSTATATASRRVSQRGRISSVPNELNKLGRKKRHAARHKYQKSASTDEEKDEGEDEDDFDTYSSSYSSGEDAEREDLFDCNNSPKITRSCSWSERRERNLQKFEGAFGRQQPKSHTQSLGYMNASYQNLTLLDYSGNQPSGRHRLEANHKRASFEMGSRKSSSDYEGIICKGNFLLDELSEIFDRNASILNDKPATEDSDDEHVPVAEKHEQEEVEKEKEVECIKIVVNKPAVPPRIKLATQSNADMTDIADAMGQPPPEVQHVQLTIRKALPRGQKMNVQERKSVELTPPTSSANISFSTFGKTFDQDPTNLRTSYAQSLEKCNFDPTEELTISTEQHTPRNMPKRRFQSHNAAAKKRNLVASTPNLNAYEPGADELEDDMYVSSAHTSMHQLPQSHAQKPLGILLPAGSRTSFSKEVSFCPVVSKYCWQEQSSEECNEAAHDGDADDDEDELLDNADAMVIYNTKENEQIAARYTAAERTQASKGKENDAKERGDRLECVITTKEHDVNEKDSETVGRARERDDVCRRRASKPVSNEVLAAAHDDDVANDRSAVSSVSLETNVVDEVTNFASTSRMKHDTITTTTDFSTSAQANTTTTTIATATATATTITQNQKSQLKQQERPLSLQLPILSEPPTNRAHYILYASQQLLDRYETQEQVEAAKMSTNYAIKCSESESPIGVPNNNNHEGHVKSSKFKADDKHPSSKGFLTRFANGFRFSLRRKKKQQQQQQQQQQQLQLEQGKQQHTQSQPVAQAALSKEQQKDAKKTNGVQKTTHKQNSPDFIYIPLKGPLPAGSRAVNASPDATVHSQHNSSIGSSASTASVKSGQRQQQPRTAVDEQLAKTSTLQKLVTGKPPLPKQPPRSLGQSAGARHAQSTSLSTAALLDAERGYYVQAEAQQPCYDDFAKQLNAGMQQPQQQHQYQQQQPQPQLATNGGLAAFTSPSRATVTQKTQMFNQLAGGGGGGRQPTMVTALPVTVSAVSTAHAAADGKIGLIETNLDTHETVISGKTRSLMDITGPQHKRYIVKRLNVTSAAYDHNIDDDADVDDDDDDDDDLGQSVGVRVKKLSSQAGGGQIASVRRPHKSMEFLLDKENQKNVLERSPVKRATEHTTYTIDSSRFTPSDLSLFMDSIDTISRLKRERHARRRQGKALCAGDSARKDTDSASGDSEDPLDTKEPHVYATVSTLTKLHKPHSTPSSSDSDEAYNSGRNLAKLDNSSNICTDSTSIGTVSTSSSIVRRQNSGNETESGVFEFDQHSQLRSLPPIRPRSANVITKPKSRINRSRIISMILSRQYAKAPSTRTIDAGELAKEQAKRRDRLLNETIQHQHENLPVLSTHRRSRRGFGGSRNSAEQDVLSKALQYLTL